MTGILGASASSSSAGSSSAPAHGKFVHVVFFWLKNPDNQAERKQFENNLNTFISGIDYIRSSHVGTAAGTDRTVVDNSYTYCLIVSFDNKDDHDAYQEHALHQKFVTDSEALWERVQVYDSIVT